MEVALALVSVLWTLLVPGLPVALLLIGRLWTWWEVAAVVPLVSLGTNFVLLQVLNRLGIRPDLRLYGVLLGVAALAASWQVLRSRRDLGRPSPYLAVLGLPALVAFLLWRAGFAGYALLAPNQDAINHNFWIARIARTGSTLLTDVKVASPLQERVASAGFYPLAWHTDVASGAALFGVPSPTASIVSTFVFWTLVLTAGLIALARRLCDRGVLLGVVAAALAQTVPLVPGVPLTWGAMTSVVGVALLPVGLFSIIVFFEETGWRSTCLLVAAGATVFLVHSPEAATLGVMVVVGACVQLVRGQLSARIVASLGAAALAGLLVVLTVVRERRGLIEDLNALLGGHDRSLNESIGSFFTLSVNVPSTQLCFGVLVLAGIWLATQLIRGPWLAVAVVSVFGTYIVAGANTQPLLRLRPLTVPWYGSYERTAWVAVPFLALLAAIPLVLLVNRARGRSPEAVAAVTGAVVLVAAQGWLGGHDVVLELRKGVAENQVAGPGSRSLFDEANRLTGRSGIIVGQDGDGSIYGYDYDGVRVTNGGYDANGAATPELEQLLSRLREICDMPEAAATLRRYRVAGFLLGTRRIAWGPPLWTERELEGLAGVEVVARSADLVLLKPRLDACR